MINQTKESKIPRRGLSGSFEKKLGKDLKELLDYVKSSNDLDMQIRDNYFEIYCDGGCVLKVGQRSMNIDPNYFDSKEQQKEVLQKAKEGKYKEYFDKATAAVKACVTKRNRNERKQQHLIACSNRNFTTNNDLVVVDIEYAVSKLKPYNHATSDRGNKKVPKFDILAVDKKGQLYAIELKDNLRSDRKGSSQNIDGHKKDFDNSIGKECANNDFVSEMKEVLTQKQALGILPKGVEINCELPIFAIAYSGNPSEKSTFDESHKGIQLVDVSVGKRYLRLHK